MSQLIQPYQGRLQSLEMKYGLHVHDMEHERSRSKHWEEVVEGWASGKGEPVSLNVLPGAEAIEVVEIMEALMNNGHALHGVNVPNQGAIPNLPHEAIVEVTSLVSSYGIQPVHVGALPEPLAATLRNHITTQQLTAEAGLTGDRQIALQAFLQDPMCQARLGIEGIAKLMDELFAAHRAHLPQFA
jgi:alpha-galactosidase